MNLKYRKANRNDLPQIVEMLSDDELGKIRENFQNPLPTEYMVAFDRINADSNQELIIVENEQMGIVGTMQLSFIPYLTYRGGIRAQIEAVRIRKDQRRTGLGKKMFEWAIQRATEKKAHVVQLTTDKKRPDAIQFYSELGFEPTHEGMKLHLK